MFGKLTKIMLFFSAFGCLVCAGLCVYIALAEPVWYAAVALFLLAALWFGIMGFKSFKDEKKPKDESE